MRRVFLRCLHSALLTLNRLQLIWFDEELQHKYKIQDVNSINLPLLRILRSITTTQK